MTPLTNGRIISTDTRISDYLAVKEMDGLPVLSRSDLIAIYECPSKWKKGVREPDERAWEKDFGSLLDCQITQPDRFSEYFVVEPLTYTPAKAKNGDKDWDYRSLVCRQWRDDQEAKGLACISPEMAADCRDAFLSLVGHPKQSESTNRLIRYSQKQVFMVAEYQDQQTGIEVLVKVLSDLVPDEDSEFGDSIFDIKTIRSAAPHKWRKSVHEFDWHTQAAMGLDVYNATLLHGMGLAPSHRTMFRHIVIENTTPYISAYKWLEKEFIDLGRDKYLCGLQKYCGCVYTGEWPDYTDEFATVDKHGYESVSPLEKMVTYAPVARVDDPAWARKEQQPA